MILRHARAGDLDHRADRAADDLSRFLDERDLLGTFYRARLLHEIGRVYEVSTGKRAADFFIRAPRHDALRRAHHAGEADHADALRADFFEALDHRLAVGAARRPQVLDPILRKTPPLDLVRAAHDGGRGDRKSKRLNSSPRYTSSAAS